MGTHRTSEGGGIMKSNRQATGIIRRVVLLVFALALSCLMHGAGLNVHAGDVAGLLVAIDDAHGNGAAATISLAPAFAASASAPTAAPRPWSAPAGR
jgi:hypothetical protein